MPNLDLSRFLHRDLGPGWAPGEGAHIDSFLGRDRQYTLEEVRWLFLEAARIAANWRPRRNLQNFRLRNRKIGDMIQ